MNTLSKTHGLVLAVVIVATVVIMALVPLSGYIPLGFMDVVTIHIPAIIGAIILELKYEAFLGLAFGLTSLQKNISIPNPTSLVFSPFIIMGRLHGSLGSLVICLAPRILIEVVVYYVYRLFMRALKNRRSKQGIALFAADVAGPLTNTLLAMNLTYLLLGDQYAFAVSRTIKWAYGAILGIIGTQGVSETLVAGVIATVIAGILLKLIPGIRG